MIEVTRPLARHAVHARPGSCTGRCTTARVRDPAVAAVRARKRVQADDSLAPDAAGVIARLKDGRKLGYHLDHCQGSAARPNWTMRECRPPATCDSHGVLYLWFDEEKRPKIGATQRCQCPQGQEPCCALQLVWYRFRPFSTSWIRSW